MPCMIVLVHLAKTWARNTVQEQSILPVLMLSTVLLKMGRILLQIGFAS